MISCCYIGLGSNLDNPLKQLRLALQALAQLPHSELQSVSRLYRSPPMGPSDQPDFLNAAACLQTTLAPLELLDRLQAIERDQGRLRRRHWGERSLDLDLLLYGEQHIDLPRLQVPHPGLLHRPFVLHPLHDLCAELVLPSGDTLESLLRRHPVADLTVMDEELNINA